MSKHTINDLRDHLFAALEGLRKGDMDIERARAIGEVAQVVINSAKVEVQHMHATGGRGSGFIDAAPALPSGTEIVKQAPGVRITRHRLEG